MATGNDVNANSTGLVKYDGAGNFSGVTVTQYDVLVGDASNGIVSVAPSSTSGVPLISQGSSSSPSFGTAVVAGGGTGVTSTTAYAVLCGGTSSTGALQSIASVGSSGQVLTSNGASALPTFQAASGGGGFLSASGSLTSASVKTLHGTPVQAIAAPGAGKVIIVTQVVGKLNYGGSNAFVAGSGQNIQIYYGTTQNALSGTAFVLSNTSLTSTANRLSTSITASTGASVIDLAYTTVANTAINLYNSSTTEISGNAAGDNTVAWQIQYFIATI